MENNSPAASPAAPPKTPWYFSRRWVLLLIAGTAPLSFLVFPLLWFSPKFSRKWKIIITIVTLAACALIAKGTMIAWQNLQSQLKDLKSAGLIS